MDQILGRQCTAMKDIKITCAVSPPCDLALVPVQCIIVKQINSERIDAGGIFDCSRTVSVAFKIIPDHVKEVCKLLKVPLAQRKKEGGNIYFVIWTSKMKKQCIGVIHISSCHFGRGFIGNKSLLAVVRTVGPHVSDSADQPHGALLLLRGNLFGNSWNASPLMVFAEILACPLLCKRFLQPVTCVANGSELEEDSHSLLEGCTWSSLPVLFLWMIKDRLDFFDNVKVAQVCQHWRSASINYPIKMQTVGDGIPWIMLDASVDGNKCVCEFINIERTKKFAIELPGFYDKPPIFSKQGWILLNRVKVYTRGQRVDSLFLINPLTKGKIEVPDIVIDYDEAIIDYMACFSTSQDGVPNCIVLSHRNLHEGKITFYITYVGGDQVWMQQSNIVKRVKFDVRGLAVINCHVYSYDRDGAMIIYDMAGQTWNELPPPISSRDGPRFYMMEREGHIWLYRPCCSDFPRACFFKLSDTHHNYWQQLASDDNDGINLSIFGSETRNILSMRIQRGVNIGWITNRRKLFCANRTCCVRFIDGLTSAQIRPDIHYDVGATWVDIG